MRIYVSDLKQAPGGAYCHPGARKFFQRHGLDWADFVKNGIEAEVVLATGDAMAVRIVESARTRNGRQ